MKNGGNRKKVIYEMLIFLIVIVFNLHCFICCCYEREVQVFTCKTVSLKALFIEQLVIAELSRARSAWSGAARARKCGYLSIREIFVVKWPCIRPPTRPSAPQAYRCKITQSTTAWPPRLFERKNKNKVESFPTLFLMSTLTWVTEKEWVIKNKGDEFRRKKDVKIS